jgi:hypothetical protein
MIPDIPLSFPTPQPLIRWKSLSYKSSSEPNTHTPFPTEKGHLTLVAFILKHRISLEYLGGSSWRTLQLYGKIVVYYFFHRFNFGIVLSAKNLAFSSDIPIFFASSIFFFIFSFIVIPSSVNFPLLKQKWQYSLFLVPFAFVPKSLSFIGIPQLWHIVLSIFSPCIIFLTLNNSF